MYIVNAQYYFVYYFLEIISIDLFIIINGVVMDYKHGFYMKICNFIQSIYMYCISAFDWKCLRTMKVMRILYDGRVNLLFIIKFIFSFFISFYSL